MGIGRDLSPLPYHAKISTYFLRLWTTCFEAISASNSRLQKGQISTQDLPVESACRLEGTVSLILFSKGSVAKPFLQASQGTRSKDTSMTSGVLSL